MMDVNLLKKGEDFDQLLETWVFFITENDFMGNGIGSDFYEQLWGSFVSKHETIMPTVFGTCFTTETNYGGLLNDKGNERND